MQILFQLVALKCELGGAEHATILQSGRLRKEDYYVRSNLSYKKNSKSALGYIANLVSKRKKKGLKQTNHNNNSKNGNWKHQFYTKATSVYA